MEDYKKKYEDALERAKKELQHCGSQDCDAARQIFRLFPELESKDEKIRTFIKGLLLPHIYDIDVVGDEIKPNKDIDIYRKALTWLEKQGEQKQQDKEYTFKSIPRLLDMIEPSEKAKFYCQKLIDTLTKEGYNTDVKIVGECLKRMNGEKVGMATMDEQDEQSKEVTYTHEIETGNGNIKALVTEKHKFNTGDWIVSKYGDIFQIKEVIAGSYKLLCPSCNEEINSVRIVDNNSHLWSIKDAKDGDVLVNGSNIFIFHFINGTRLMGYCHVNIDDGRFYDDLGKNECFCLIDAIVTPVTKEQRELLFRKMKEEGFEWDATTKELSHKEVTKKSDKVWSEEDEIILNGIIDDFGDGKTSNMLQESWLKSIKERMQPQPKQDGKWKWEEDDEKFFKENILIELGNIDGVSPELYSKIIDWISLIKKRLS